MRIGILRVSCGCLTLLAISSPIRGSDSLQGCGCAPSFPSSPSSTTYTVEFAQPSLTTPQQKQLFNDLIDEAAIRWEYEYYQRGVNLQINRETSGGAKTIYITNGISDGSANYSGSTMTLPLEWILNPSTFSNNYIKSVVQHEFGHVLGLSQASGSCSIMSNMTVSSWNNGFTQCDLDKLTSDVGPVRRDEDEDGWSPDDSEPDQDCDGTTSGDPGDNNPNIYPGAEGTSPVCAALQTEQELPTGHDYNCDGVDDAEQAQEACPNSPIVIDVRGNGFDLTDRAGGVLFDLDGDRRAERIPWTAAGGDDAWLALDRNGNGLIETGRELFGNFTPQPPAPHKNGFLALAMFDANGDRWIDAADPIFRTLRAWTDINHDGVSQPAELRGLQEVGIVRLSLDYREMLRRDEHGNWFRFGARVVDGRARDVGPMAFDVFFDYPAGRVPPSPTRDRERPRGKSGR